MRKIKISLTILILYEFVVLTILQIPDYCVRVFNQNFCSANNFKYFLLCIMLPVLFGLVLWWLPDISRGFCKNRCQCEAQKSDLHKTAPLESSANQDIEKLITAAIVMGVHRLALRHPKTKEILSNISDILKHVDTKPRKK